MSWYSYLVCGLILRFNTQIPYFWGSQHKHVDIDVIFSDTYKPFWQDASHTPYYKSLQKLPGGKPLFVVSASVKQNAVHWRYHDDTEFLVKDNGATIYATWSLSGSLEKTLSYLLGPILSFVLRVRGKFVFHGGAFVKRDHVVAIVGPSRSGKSTIVATLATLGYSIVTDDILILDNKDSIFNITPSYPGLRLWPCTTNTLFDGSRELVEIAPQWKVKLLQLNNDLHFEVRHLPLAAIYFLDGRQGNSSYPQIETVTPKQAFLKLVQHRFISPSILDRQAQIEDFDLISRLSTHIPMRQITPTNNIREVYTLAQAILDDLSSLPGLD